MLSSLEVYYLVYLIIFAFDQNSGLAREREKKGEQKRFTERKRNICRERERDLQREKRDFQR